MRAANAAVWMHGNQSGRLAQLGERRVRNAEVASSILAPSTNDSCSFQAELLLWRLLGFPHVSSRLLNLLHVWITEVPAVAPGMTVARAHHLAGRVGVRPLDVVGVGVLAVATEREPMRRDRGRRRRDRAAEDIRDEEVGAKRDLHGSCQSKLRAESAQRHHPRRPGQPAFPADGSLRRSRLQTREKFLRALIAKPPAGLPADRLDHLRVGLALRTVGSHRHLISPMSPAEMGSPQSLAKKAP